MFERDWFALERLESELGHASLLIYGATATSAHEAIQRATGNGEVYIIESSCTSLA
jgi:hypothetical protein